MKETRQLIEKLEQQRILSKEEFVFLLSNLTQEDIKLLREKASEIAHRHFGNKIYTRGLIEFTNYCKNDFYYLVSEEVIEMLKGTA